MHVLVKHLACNAAAAEVLAGKPGLGVGREYVDRRGLDFNNHTQRQNDLRRFPYSLLAQQALK